MQTSRLTLKAQMQDLKPGDILSYSSGSHDRGPYGFRTIRPGGNLMALFANRYPQVLQGFDGRVPMVINAYPACIGTFDFGITVDSYLSHSTASRALHLAHLERYPVMLIGQPLYLADLLFRHLATNPVLPPTLLLVTGGYVMPRSLEMSLRQLIAAVTPRAAHGTTLNLINGYGVAEVDAGCLWATQRTPEGHLVYEPRSADVEVVLEGSDLLLSLRSPNGGYVVERFPTGDSGIAAQAIDGTPGYVIWNNERLHPNVLKILESWSFEDWERRTGYLYYGREIRFQLRKGFEPKVGLEAEFHDYEKKYGHYWLFKPVWGRAQDSGREHPLRRTIM
ncbi:MAG: hypothetical protein AB7K71_06425 [Polyangiaceae bacterium]